jgi:alpha-tubulin suppressor-like RCC1 family protein
MFTAWRRWLASSLCVLLGALGAGCGGSSRRTGQALGSVSTGPIASIAGSGFAGYALLTNGRVWAWGDDLEGQIGTGGAWLLSATPVEVPGLTKVIAIAGGANTAYALRRDGTVWAWGDDAQDELGDSGASPRQIPKRVRVPGGIVAIAAGAFSAYALRRDGTVWAWGSNSFDQLGTGGGILPGGVPRRVDRLAGIVAIAGGSGDGYALDRDGRVWAWGDNSLGQLGPGGCTAPRDLTHDGSGCPVAGGPVEVRGLTGVTAIAAGADSVYALRRDGTVWAWGDGSFGALGIRTGHPFVDQPVRIRGLEHVVSITAGAVTGYAIVRDGTVWAWGRGVDGELGDGSTGNQAVPTRVLKLTGVIKLAGGGTMAYALDRHGLLWAWGSDLYGQLGNGYVSPGVDEPTPVPGPAGVTPEQRS